MAKLCSRNIIILFITKILRMFAFGLISVVFIQSLISKGLQQSEIGILNSLIAVGDIIISMVLTTRADRFGRKKVLMLSACLKIFAGTTYAISNNYYLLIISGIFGVLTVNGGQIGPFLPIQQAAITQMIQNEQVSQKQLAKDTARALGLYNMCSYLSQAMGNLFAGVYISACVSKWGGKRQQYYSHIVFGYAIFGLIKFICYLMLDNQIQAKPEKQVDKKILNFTGLTSNSTKIISLLSVLFFVDAFAGGFVAQSFISFYYEKKYQLQWEQIGGLLSICNILGGISGLVSSVLVNKIGAITTMIVTHLPSNILLICIAFSNHKLTAVVLLMFRFCISQMDVPARQTYVSMVVSSQQRSAANGITNIVRSIGVGLASPVAGMFWGLSPQSFSFSFPFLIAGLLKSLYDVTLGLCFLKQKCHPKDPQIRQKDFKELQNQSGVFSESRMQDIESVRQPNELNDLTEEAKQKE